MSERQNKQKKRAVSGPLDAKMTHLPLSAGSRRHLESHHHPSFLHQQADRFCAPPHSGGTTQKNTTKTRQFSRTRIFGLVFLESANAFSETFLAPFLKNNKKAWEEALALSPCANPEKKCRAWQALTIVGHETFSRRGRQRTCAPLWAAVGAGGDERRGHHSQPAGGAPLPHRTRCFGGQGVRAPEGRGCR